MVGSGYAQSGDWTPKGRPGGAASSGRWTDLIGEASLRGH